METTTQEMPPQPQGPRRLRRSRDDRVLGGVCGGLGAYFNVDPVLFRIAAVVLTLLGGAGALAYLAMLLLVPNAPEGPAAATAETQPLHDGDQRNRGLMIAGVIVLLLVAWPVILGGSFAIAAVGIPLAILVAIGVLVWWLVSGEGPSGSGRDIARRAALGMGVLILCWVLAIGGAWAAAAGGEAVVAGIVIAAGIAVLAGAFSRPVRFLILPAVVVALSAGTVAAAGIDLDGGIGKKHYRPGSLSDLRGTYQLGMGDLVVDLRDVDLPPGDTRLKLDVGVGQAQLIVPSDVCVASQANVGAGAVTVLGEDNGGVDFDFADLRSAPSRTSRLVVDGDVGIGHFEVDDDATLARDDPFSPHFDPVGNVDVTANTACNG